MEIKLDSGTVYNLSSDTSRMTITVSKNGSTQIYIAAAQARVTNSKGKGGVILVTRENGSYVELPIEKIGIESQVIEFMNANKQGRA